MPGSPTRSSSLVAGTKNGKSRILEEARELVATADADVRANDSSSPSPF